MTCKIIVNILAIIILLPLHNKFAGTCLEPLFLVHGVAYIQPLSLVRSRKLSLSSELSIITSQLLGHRRRLNVIGLNYITNCSDFTNISINNNVLLIVIYNTVQLRNEVCSV